MHTQPAGRRQFFWQYTGVFCGVLGYTGMYWGILGYTRMYWGILGYTGVYWGILGCTGIYQGILGCMGYIRVYRVSRVTEEYTEEYTEEFRMSTTREGERDAYSTCWQDAVFLVVYCGVLGYTGMYWGILGYTRMHCGILGCTGIYWGILGCMGYIRVYGVSKVTELYNGVYQDFKKFTKHVISTFRSLIELPSLPSQ